MDTKSIAGHPKRWAILGLVLAAECMDLLDGTIVNVAAPTIRKDLHASAAALQLGDRRLRAGVRRRTAGRRAAR